MLAAIHIKDYDYALPDERIARMPAQMRDMSKLLIYSKGACSSACFHDIAQYLPQDTMLVFNNTKVLPARLMFKTDSGAAIEILCLQPHFPADYVQALSQTHSCQWTCLIGNNKRWKHGLLRLSFMHNGAACTLHAKRMDTGAGSMLVEFAWNGCTFAQALEHCGSMPLPPYLRRSAHAADSERYQTIFAKHSGSVAAPTAGLHFSNEVMDALCAKGIAHDEITLHVGAGTFLPVKTATANEHIMHKERFMVTLTLLERVRSCLGSVVAVGTTSARTLESLHWLGVKLMDTRSMSPALAQWEAYNLNAAVSAADSLGALIAYMKQNGMQRMECATSLMLMPPYRYKVVSGMVTNFHQPQSTLLLLLAAMVGDDWRAIYDYAMRHDFRFLSYGDASLILPHL